MRSKVMKTVVVSAIAMLFTVAPATQALAWCGGGGCWGYGSGYYGQGYNPPVTQQRYTPAPQNYVPTNAIQTTSQTNKNDFDPTVYEIQVVLFEKGYYEGDIDGLYGSATKAALLKFQGDNNISNGENADVKELKADKATLKALGL